MIAESEVCDPADFESILQRPSQHRSGNNGREAEHIAADDIDANQEPLPTFHEGEALIGVAGKGRVRTAETNDHQQAPARIDEHAFGREDEEESDEEAPGDVNQKRAIGKRRRKIAGDQKAKEVTGARSNDGAKRDPKIVNPGVVQDGLPPAKIRRSYQPEGG